MLEWGEGLLPLLSGWKYYLFSAPSITPETTWQGSIVIIMQLMIGSVWYNKLMLIGFLKERWSPEGLYSLHV